MKITGMESFFVKPRWHFLKVSTDEGICGWGEPIVEGRARTVAMAVKELEPVLIGQNPLEIERIWTESYRGTFYRGGPVLVSALSGIDQALLHQGEIPRDAGLRPSGGAHPQAGSYLCPSPGGYH